MKNSRASVFIGMIFLVVITVITTLIFSGFGNLVLTGSIEGYTLKELAFIRKIMGSKEVLLEKF